MRKNNNEIIIKGRVYKYEVRHTITGKTVCRFGLQFWNGKYKDGKNQYAFVNCKGFDDFKLTEKQDVVVCGRLGYEEWTDKQNNKRSAIVIFVNSVYQDEPIEEQPQEEESPLLENPFV